MKTLTTFAEVMEAQLLRTRLEDSGIPAYVRDENTATLASYAIGGVRVDVSDEDFDRAVQFLQSEPPTPSTPSTPPTPSAS
jgi:hypothetical protein